MTVQVSVSSLVWAVVIAIFVSRLDKFAHAWLQARQGSQPKEVPPIPGDLMALALSEDAGSQEATKQAQKAVVDAITEAWRRLGDWNKVRTAMGVATQ